MKKKLPILLVCLCLPFLAVCQQKTGIISKNLSFFQKVQLSTKAWNTLSERQKRALERNERLTSLGEHSRILSRSSAVEEKMDSSITWLVDQNSGTLVPSRKNETLFDGSGNLVDDAHYIWEPDANQWIGSNRKAFSFGAEGRLDLEIVYQWDIFSGTWNPDQRVEYLNEGPGNSYSGFTSYSLEGFFQEWLPVDQTEILFNEIGLAIVQNSYIYIDSLEAFILDLRVETQYGENGEVQATLLSLSDGLGGEVVPAFLFQEEYDTRGNNINSVFLQWDESLSDWFLLGLTSTEYDELNRPVLFVNNFFDPSTETFEAIYGEATEYDEKGRRSRMVTGALNFGTEEFGTTGQNRFLYDENGNLVEFATDSFELANESFFPVSWDSFSYDTTLLVSEVFATDFSLPEAPVNKYLGSQSFSLGDSSTSQRGVFEVYYSPLVSTRTADELSPNIRVFPNPTRGHLSLEIPKGISRVSFTLLDLQGRTVFAKELVGSQQVQLGALALGIYLYRVQAKEGIQQGKLVISK